MPLFLAALDLIAPKKNNNSKKKKGSFESVVYSIRESSAFGGKMLNSTYADFYSNAVCNYLNSISDRRVLF